MIDTVRGVLERLSEITWLRFVVAPVLGGIIGYITNDLALKMLFRPYEEKRIGRFRVPFTPGLIPSQKGRIAKSLGEVIAGNLLDAGTLRREALADSTIEKLRGTITSWLEKQAGDERPLRERLEERMTPERIDDMEIAISDKATDFLMEKLKAAGLGEIVAEQVVSTIQGKLSHVPMGFLLEGMMEPLRAGIANSVERKLAESGPEMLRQKLDEELDALLAKSVSELADSYKDRIPMLTETMLGLYRSLFEDHIEALLGAVRLDEIIERRIEGFDARELEAVVFGVMRRELRAIVYLGAFLGFLMGFINLLF